MLNVHCEQGTNAYLFILVAYTAENSNMGTKNDQRFHVMNQTQKFPAFIEQQAAKIMDNRSSKTPILLPKPKRKLLNHD